MSGDGSPPVGLRGEAPERGLGDEVSQKLKQFADICFTDFDLRNDQHLKISYNLTLPYF